MGKLKEILKDMLNGVLAITMLFIGLICTAYFLVKGVSIISIVIGYVGFWILSPAIQSWKDYFWYFFNKDKEN
jgi:hypothetical protein